MAESGAARGRAFDAVLFDFFGTLVDYEARWDRVGYPRSRQCLVDWGHPLADDDFAVRWAAAQGKLERAAIDSCREFSMLDIANAFCRAEGIDLSSPQQADLVAAVVGDWQRHVRHVPGVPEMLERLSEHTRLGIVSNTHARELVPALVEALGIADLFVTTVLSIDHGWRKPHPSIFQVTGDRMGVDTARVVFVGDNYEADYVGPKRIGMTALLIDPDDHHGIAPAERLSSILDVENCLDDLTRPV